MDDVFVGIDHVQLAAPPGCEAEARRFFGELLGLPELEKPAALALRGGLWFQCGAQQIHIGIEQDFRPARKAHPALRLRDEVSVEMLEARLKAAGIVTRRDIEVEDAARFFAEDPWGNRVEFVAPKSPLDRSHPRPKGLDRMDITRTVLLEALLDPTKLTGRVEVQRIDLGPGQASPPHLHPCPVLGLVLKGAVRFQLEGGPERILRAGEAFYEPAGVAVPHFDNASGTEGMSFVAFYLMDRNGEEKVRIL